MTERNNKKLYALAESAKNMAALIEGPESAAISNTIEALAASHRAQEMRIRELEAVQAGIRARALEDAANAVEGMGDTSPPMSYGVKCAERIRAL